jgi:hypothetical protein
LIKGFDYMYFLPESVRAWLYRVLVAYQPLAVMHWGMTEQEAALWIGFAGAVLGVALAASQTQTHPEDYSAEEWDDEADAYEEEG